MTSLEFIAALIAAVDRNDTPVTTCLLDVLDARLPVEEQLALLEKIFGQQPSAKPQRLAACP